MIRKFTIFLFCAFLAMVFILIYSAKFLIPKTDEPPTYLHIWNDPTRIYHEVSLHLIYFVPKDQSVSAIGDWPERLNECQKQLLAFHQRQFPNSTTLSIDILPEPVYGEKNLVDYLVSSENGLEQQGI